MVTNVRKWHSPATRQHKMLIIIGKVFYCVGWRFAYPTYVFKYIMRGYWVWVLEVRWSSLGFAALYPTYAFVLNFYADKNGVA